MPYNYKKYQQYQKEYRQKHKDEIKENAKKYYSTNKDNIKEQHKNYQLLNKDKIKEIQKQTYLANKDKIKEQHKKYYSANKDIIKNKYKEYQREYRTSYKDKKNQTRKLKTKTDIIYRITCQLRSRLNKALKNKNVIKSKHTLELLNCTLDYLKNYLQETAIKNGYKDFNINNYSSNEYHIDHIIPCDAFNLKCSYHQKLCFNWSNLQILTAEENLSKNNKIN